MINNTLGVFICELDIVIPMVVNINLFKITIHYNSLNFSL